MVTSANFLEFMLILRKLVSEFVELNKEKMRISPPTVP
jgi:hypothetical protein